MRSRKSKRSLWSIKEASSFFQSTASSFKRSSPLTTVHENDSPSSVAVRRRHQFQTTNSLLEIVLDPSVFVGVWMIVFVLRLATTGVLLVFIWYFHILTQVNPILEEWYRDVHTLPRKTINVVWYFMLATFAVHLYKLLDMVHASLLDGKLVFRTTQRFQLIHKRKLGGGYSSIKRVQPEHWRRRAWKHTQLSLRHTMDMTSRVMTSVMNHFGFLGIRSQWFNEVFAIRETIELITQTFQCYRMQCLILDDVTNCVGLMTLFCNAVSTFLIEFITKEHHEKTLKTRLVLMVIDACLDFMFAIGLPLILMSTLLLKLDWTRNAFPDQDLCHDLWYPKTIREFQQFILSSSWDIVSQSVFHIGLIHCLWRVQSVVKRKDQLRAEQQARWFQSRMHHAASPSSFTSHTLPPTPHLKVFGTHSMEKTKSSSANSRNKHSKGGAAPWIHLLVPSLKRFSDSPFHRIKNKILEMVPIIHAIIGIVAVTASFAARFTVSKPVDGCHLSGYEWFHDHPVCVVMEINCFRRQITGASADMEAILRGMDTHFLFSLLFSHCPALEMPHGIQQIKGLYMIDTFNSTIVNWPPSAALHEQTNPQMTRMRFIQTNFSNGSLPEGLVTFPFPSAMTQLVFSHTNLRVLPQAMGTNWKPISSLYMDHCDLREFPMGFRDLASVRTLSLVNNAISHLPSGVLDQMHLLRMYLSGNPLQTLPNQLPDSVLEHSCTISMQFSLVATTPPWLERFIKRVFEQNRGQAICQTSLYASPVCSNRATRSMLHRNQPNGTHQTLQVKSLDWLLTTCLEEKQIDTQYGCVPYIQQQRLV